MEIAQSHTLGEKNNRCLYCVFPYKERGEIVSGRRTEAVARHLTCSQPIIFIDIDGFYYSRTVLQ